jgi:hypothetical protein
MAITAIRSIRNLVGGSVYNVGNQEQPNDTGGRGHSLLVRSGSVVACNIWIPWCNSQVDFDNHHKIVVVPDGVGAVPILFAIWQQGDYVRYTRDGLFYDNGALVHGNCTVGGDRSVEIRGADIFHADLRFF